MKAAQQIVETLLEGEMPDWLKKKISGKKEDDGDGKDDEGGDGDDKPSKSEKSEKSEKSSASNDVASVTGKVSYS